MTSGDSNAHKKIGVIGGTFDPPHYAHLVLAQTGLDELGLSRVLFVPAGAPPHKVSTRTPIEHRVNMLQIAIADNPAFVLSRVDIDRPGPHYSVDMIDLIQQEYPGSEIYFLMGEDMFNDLPNWKLIHELLASGICIAVMHRPCEPGEFRTDKFDPVLPGLSTSTVMLHSPLLEISSTDIVERLHHGRSARYLLPDSVLQYINKYGLYRATTA